MGFSFFGSDPNRNNLSEHFEILRSYASKCLSIAEFGTSEMMSCWPLLKGLKDTNNNNNNRDKKEITCYDRKPMPPMMEGIRKIAANDGIRLRYVQGNTLQFKLNTSVDMLFIDTFHAYPQLKRELDRHHKRVNKYIAIFHTETDGDTSEMVRLYYDHNYDTMLEELQCTPKDLCRGLKPAITDFLSAHPEWSVCEDAKNQNGLVILARKK
jgi:hypothetical protein